MLLPNYQKCCSGGERFRLCRRMWRALEDLLGEGQTPWLSGWHQWMWRQAASTLLEAVQDDASLAGDAFLELYSGEGGTDAMDWPLKSSKSALAFTVFSIFFCRFIIALFVNLSAFAQQFSLVPRSFWIFLASLVPLRPGALCWETCTSHGQTMKECSRRPRRVLKFWKPRSKGGETMRNYAKLGKVGGQKVLRSVRVQEVLGEAGFRSLTIQLSNLSGASVLHPDHPETW